MGTETKLNCYTENTSTGSCSNNGICIPKVQLKGSNGSHSIPPQQPKQQQQAQCIYSNGHVVNGKDKDVLNGTVANSIVPFIPLHIDEHHVIDGAKEILKVIRPHWNLQEVHFKIFTNGITNKLVGCFYKQPSTPTKTVNGNSSDSGSTANGHSAHTRNGATAHCYDDINDAGNLSDSDTDSDTAATATAATAAASTEPSNNVVLVRVYGNKTDLLIDRKAETRNILLLHSYGFAPSLYATFKNGLAYDYVPGVTLNTSNILLPEVWGLVARRMADMHRMVQCKTNGDQPPVPMLWKKTQSFMDLVPEQFSDPAKQQRPRIRAKAEKDIRMGWGGGEDEGVRLLLGPEYSLVNVRMRGLLSSPVSDSLLPISLYVSVSMHVVDPSIDLKGSFVVELSFVRLSFVPCMHIHTHVILLWSHLFLIFAVVNKA